MFCGSNIGNDRNGHRILLNEVMTSDQHIDRIVAKCRENIATAERQRTKWAEFAEYVADLNQCLAGWRSTIASIAALKSNAAYWDGRPNCTNKSQDTLDAIRAAWPEESL
jgi:hypothetical protein